MKSVFITRILLMLLLLSSQPLSAAEEVSPFPVIEKLHYSDLNYRQLQEDIEFFHRAFRAGKQLPPLMFYEYEVTDDDNIFSIASRAGLSYDTIASLNRLNSSSGILRGRKLLLPSQPGIFIPEKPASDLEFISISWRAPQLSGLELINIFGEKFYFLPDQSFHNVERAYFLGILFINPLPKGVVSSGYGFRTSPFTGSHTFHRGIDIAAPEGTYVYAARSGRVISKGSNSTYGNYIELEHEGGYTSFYGHLNKIFVELHDTVNSTMIIAEVGSTGLSTGPHLHFEIRRDGTAENPSKLTPGLD